MTSNLPTLPKLIEVTDRDVIVDGQSIGQWCGLNVQVIPGVHGVPPRVIVELIAERVVTDLHNAVDVVPLAPEEPAPPTNVEQLPADGWIERRYEQRYIQHPHTVGVLRGAWPHLGRVRHEPAEDGRETVTDVDIAHTDDGTILGIVI